MFLAFVEKICTPGRQVGVVFGGWGPFPGQRFAVESGLPEKIAPTWPSGHDMKRMQSV